MGRLHRLRHPAVGAALGRRLAHRAEQLGGGGRRRGGPGADRRRDPRDRRRTGRRSTSSSSPARARPTPRGRPCSTATAASTSRSPRPTPRRRWPGWPPAACGRWPTCAAAPSTARSGTGRACASASRTCSTTSPPPGSTWSPQGWTTHEQLAVMGGSNGGLLVGATLTQRPDLAAAVVCSAPLLDMVRYERFGLGRTWNDEYGTAEDPDGARLAARLLAVPRGPRGDGVPGGAVHDVRVRHPGRSAARPQARRGAAARHGLGRRRSCCAGRPRSGTAPVP